MTVISSPKNMKTQSLEEPSAKEKKEILGMQEDAFSIIKRESIICRTLRPRSYTVTHRTSMYASQSFEK
ncbi:hypothetical protein TNCV_1823211 [Trichonephila clavipes]|nr:hypothetical protein TNCV_1823211 [Trichonephila clavipes]